MARVLVLGGGFGGLAAATRLRQLLPHEHAVDVIDQKEAFLMGLAKLWAMDGRRPLEAGTRRLDALNARGIGFHRAMIQRIDAAGKRVITDRGDQSYDRLIIALGAESAPQALPGFEAVVNLYDANQAAALHPRLKAMRQGRILLFISSLPFRCPPAPYEAAFLIDDLLRRHGSRARVQLQLSTPEPHPLPVAPPEFGNRLLPWLKERGIDYYPGMKPRAVGEGRYLEYESGVRKEADLLIGVPPHRCPPVVREAGFADSSGWVPVDRASMRTSVEGVWAIGDCTVIKLANGKPMPKAGVLAEQHAATAAVDVARSLGVEAPAAPFGGVGTCYVEVGGGKAVEAEGRFFHLPEPEFRFSDASTDALEKKRRFEAERLERWFGTAI